MADQQITVLTAPGVGSLQITKTAAVGGADDNQFANPSGSRVLFFVENTDVATRAITVRSIACSHGRTLDVTFTIAATTGFRVIGPLPPDLFNTTTGLVEINTDIATNVKMFAIAVPG